MSTITETNIVGIPSNEGQYAPHGCWAYCEGNHEIIIQTHTEGRAKFDCPKCGAIMTSGKWTSKHDLLLKDVNKYLRHLEQNLGYNLQGMDVWMEIRNDWCVIMVDCIDSDQSGMIQFHGLSTAHRFDLFTEDYNRFRVMLTRDMER